MKTRDISAGFHPVSYHQLFQEHVHDAYKTKGKLPEPTVCPDCGAVFHDGRWQWLAAPANAHSHACPACLRQHDHYPAGYVTLNGEFFAAHKDEVMHLIHNEAEHARAEHPLKRIMDIEEKDGMAQVTTTDIHLARQIGEALRHAYQGKLEFHYNPEQNLLRVGWMH